MTGTVILTKHKSFVDVLADAHDGIDTFLVSSVNGDQVTMGSRIDGVGATSYPIYRFSYAKTKGILGFFKRKVIAEECLDVAFSFDEMLEIFEEVRTK